MMNLNLDGANVIYVENIINNTLAQKIFDNVSAVAELKEICKVNNTYKLKRKTIVYIDKSIIDTYILPKIWGDDVSVFEFTPELIELKNCIQTQLTELKYEFNICLANYYSTGKNNIGWHSDNEERGEIECIASISLGATREFAFRKKEEKNILKIIELNNNSLLIMDKGCQEKYEHCLILNKKIRQPRLNLTFRKFKFDSYSIK